MFHEKADMPQGGIHAKDARALWPEKINVTRHTSHVTVLERTKLTVISADAGKAFPKGSTLW